MLNRKRVSNNQQLQQRLANTQTRLGRHLTWRTDIIRCGTVRSEPSAFPSGQKAVCARMWICAYKWDLPLSFALSISAERDEDKTVMNKNESGFGRLEVVLVFPH